jgi:hypothetical protein
MTRRELIWHAARTGGYGAAFLVMRSMDLLASPLAVTTPFELPPNAGRGTKVAILHFDSLADLNAALASPEGQAAAAGLSNFASAGTTLLIYDSKAV